MDTMLYVLRVPKSKQLQFAFEAKSKTEVQVKALVVFH